MPELTVAADLAWRVAALEAQRGRADAIGVDHLLLGLLSLEKLLEESAGLSRYQQEAVQAEQTALVRVLRGHGLDATTLRRTIRENLPPRRARADRPVQRDPACLAAFARAEALAEARGADACGVLDLLAALLERPSPALAGRVGDLERLRWDVQAALAPVPVAGLTPMSAPPTPPAAISEQPPVPADPAPISTVPAVLLQFGRDLTADAEAGRLPPVIGRQDEMLQVVRVLRRRTKNGPVLIGEAGVGKTAVVEGLAQRIVEGALLPGRRIVALSIASVVAGTSYRGQFEERLEEILAALRAHPEVILFLDELHTIVGAGDADGRLDAASILKPALSRGEIACIGATTIDEYRRHVECDPALERRFQPVLVREPSQSETLAILEGLRPDLERHHGVRIEAEAVLAAVELTVRYVPGRRLPDKAVDALDEACARTSVPSLGAHMGRSLVVGEISPAVTRETVEAVISAWTGSALGRPEQSADGRLADLEARLAERIVGQPEAIRQVAERVRLARAGLTDPERPAAVILLVGLSGVGKTTLALALAELLADGPGGDPALVRLAMAEYAERQHAARLIGVAGYAGRDQDGQLTGPLRRSPRAVVLLDEIDKAHPDVVDLMLPLLATGGLTDAHGRLADGRQAIFVLTARLPGGGAGRRALGFRGPADGAPTREALASELWSVFRPELLARIDEVVLLRPLTETDLLEIARRRIAALQERLHGQHGIDLMVSPEALALLARQAASGSGGAHEIERVITRLLAEPLSRELLSGRLQPGARLRAEPRGDAIAFLTPHTGSV